MNNNYNRIEIKVKKGKKRKSFGGENSWNSNFGNNHHLSTPVTNIHKTTSLPKNNHSKQSKTIKRGGTSTMNPAKASTPVVLISNPNSSQHSSQPYSQQEKLQEKIQEKQEKNQEKQENQLIRKKIVVGSIAKKLVQQGSESTHAWKVYLRAYDETDSLESFVESVSFVLHSSFVNPVRKILCAPYEVQCEGWGEFDVQLHIAFRDASEAPVIVTHHLSLSY